MHQCEQKQMNTDACRKELVCTKKEQGCTLARSYEQKAMDLCAHSKLQKSSEALTRGYREIFRSAPQVCTRVHRQMNIPAL